MAAAGERRQTDPGRGGWTAPGSPKPSRFEWLQKRGDQVRRTSRKKLTTLCPRDPGGHEMTQCEEAIRSAGWLIACAIGAEGVLMAVFGGVGPQTVIAVMSVPLASLLLLAAAWIVGGSCLYRSLSAAFFGGSLGCFAYMYLSWYLIDLLLERWHHRDLNEALDLYTLYSWAFSLLTGFVCLVSAWRRRRMRKPVVSLY